MVQFRDVWGKFLRELRLISIDTSKLKITKHAFHHKGAAIFLKIEIPNVLHCNTFIPLFRTFTCFYSL